MVAIPTGRPLTAPVTAPASPMDFAQRHLGLRPDEVARMLAVLGCDALETLIDQAVPPGLRSGRPLALPPAQSEAAALAALAHLATENQIWRSYIGLGYYGTWTPPIIQRNILENPAWYTAYTPYQAEIAQGRLEALLNFQTLVSDLTGMDLANASLLDEGTAAAEAMTLCFNLCVQGRRTFAVAADCHPQTLAVLQTRAEPLGIQIHVSAPEALELTADTFGLLVQYPGTEGVIRDYRNLVSRAQAQAIRVTVAADLLSLTLLTPPGEWGADVVVGSSQRFGIPLGYGGPHAAFFATREAYKRQVPGRIVGVSKDSHGRPALRLALQTREQHIRREKATSNICTAQVLLAVMAGMYAVYHGPAGLRQIAERIHTLTLQLAAGLRRLGYGVPDQPVFDTLKIHLAGRPLADLMARCQAARLNLRPYDAAQVGVSLDELTTPADVEHLLRVFAGTDALPWGLADLEVIPGFPTALTRTSPYLTEAVFQDYHSETELLRYIRRLESKDLTLAQAMIPLGSCTMKLNATAELLPVSWPAFSQIHPFAPVAQAQGYQRLITQLSTWLAEITGFSAISLQPNAGSQGEYTGLLVIRAYHRHRGEPQRRVCLIPTSAHGTNPASAVMAGLEVVTVACDAQGNVDRDDLEAKAQAHAERLAALMITYPSTHGVFEEGIRDICDRVHHYGGQVYLDGANLNALVGLCRPAEFGVDVAHLNLHKTFCIPHGGGGPGVGPIGVAAHLVPYLPSHPLVSPSQPEAIGPVASAPWGSASILPIPWMYIALMGPAGLTQATQMAILSANYLAERLAPHYPILYRGTAGRVAHECILDLRPFKKSAGIEVEDVAKRLMDYGFHAPTMSWPVAGTLMVEPTESESLAELDRFCEAMIAIRQEIAALERGEADPKDNPLKHAPHTAEALIQTDWPHAYSREQAAYPLPWLRQRKVWPGVGRVDNAYGDRNLVCSCLPLEAYAP
ncbi:MAG: aminomethyl-transferring glycine dehydrogenase [Gloeomargaritaceae cyanobacterium C42_A2020_066]|nr:aminomethyl-transferring glycine dehydrogenase [Gloeomargaritaceae cyanobacterium C42_A2020_066]